LHLAHEFVDGFVSVETEVSPEASQEEAEWDALQDVLGNYIYYGSVLASEPEPPPQKKVSPDFPITLNIERQEVKVPVDGVGLSFVKVGDPTRWFAWAQIDDRTVRIRGWNRSSHELSLVSVDPATYEIRDHPPPAIWDRGWRSK
jgi:hypothetical protein